MRNSPVFEAPPGKNGRGGRILKKVVWPRAPPRTPGTRKGLTGMFKLYTDTPANLPLELISKYDIGVIPLHYAIGGREYPAPGDGAAAFDGKSFYDSMRKGLIPHTSMISIGAFSDAFEQSLAAGIDVLYLGISSGVSGTCHSASLAADEMRERYPERKIAVIDTLAASLAEGLLVRYAAELKSAGASFEETVARTEQKVPEIRQYFTVENLVYLKNGGRISGTAAALGNILQIKPILMGDEEGKIVLQGKTIGRKKAIEALVKKYQELASDLSEPIGISHGDCLEDAEDLARRIRACGHRGDVMIDFFEPVTGSHAGPGALAVFFYGVRR